MEYESVFVVVRETWDGVNVHTSDLFMSLDETKANDYRDLIASQDDTLFWDAAAEMWRYGGRYQWEKIYVVENLLDEEL